MLSRYCKASLLSCMMIIVIACIGLSAANAKRYGTVLNELQEASNLYSAGQVELACNKFEEVLEREGISENVEKNATFFLGKCLLKLSQYDKALTYFKDLATRLDPDAEVPTLETARTYLKLGEFARADYYFQRLLKDPTVSDKMKKSIRAVVEKLPSRTKVRYTVTTGLTGDTNVNSGPANSTIQLFNLPFELSDNSLPQRDVGTQMRLNTQVSKVLNRNNFVSANIGINDTSYFNHSRFDANALSLSASWRHRHKDVMLNLTPYFASQWLDRQNFSQIFGVSASMSRNATKRLIVAPFVNMFDQRFDNIQDRANATLGGGLSLIYAHTDTLTLSTQVAVNHSNARNKVNSNNRLSFNAKLTKQFSPLFQYELGIAINNAKYLQPTPAFNTRRYDIQYMYTTGGSYSLERLGMKDAMLKANVTHISNRSNQKINQRNRTILGLSVVQNF